MTREKKYFSLRDAARYVGKPLGTFRDHAYEKGKITGTVVDRTWVATRTQLDDYKEHGFTTIVPDKLYGTRDAAEYVGLSYPEFKQEAFIEKRVPYELVTARRAIFCTKDLDGLKRLLTAEKAERERAAAEPAETAKPAALRVLLKQKKLLERRKKDGEIKSVSALVVALLEKWAAGEVQAGDPPTNGKLDNLYVRIPSPLVEKAEAAGVTLSDVVAYLLQQWLDGKIDV